MAQKLHRNASQIKWINFYPPYIGAGIRLKSFDKVKMNDFLIEMKQTWYNRNLFGTHFGGSLYAMCDPWFVFICICNLGSDYIVWDKSASIRFKKPGTGRVRAFFHIDDEVLSEFKAQADRDGKMTTTLHTVITNEDGEVIAELDKEIYIRKKNSDGRIK